MLPINWQPFLNSCIWIMLCKGPPVATHPWIAFSNTTPRTTPGAAAAASQSNRHDLVHPQPAARSVPAPQVTRRQPALPPKFTSVVDRQTWQHLVLLTAPPKSTWLLRPKGVLAQKCFGKCTAIVVHPSGWTGQLLELKQSHRCPHVATWKEGLNQYSLIVVYSWWPCRPSVVCRHSLGIKCTEVFTKGQHNWAKWTLAILVILYCK